MKFKLTKVKMAVALLAIGGVTNVAMADDEDLGCEFVLCMGAKNPLGIAECVSPVKKVLKMVKKGKKPPICRGQDGKKIDYSVSFIPPKPVASDRPKSNGGGVTMPPLGAGNNNIPTPSQTEFCPSGLTTSNYGGNTMFHTGALPSGYNPFDYKELNMPIHPFSDFRIPNTNLFNIQTGKEDNGLAEYYTYKQRVCISFPPKHFINQQNQDGKGHTMHVWVDKAVLLTGKDANKRVWVSTKVNNALGRPPMLAELAGKEVTPETIKQVQEAREEYTQAYENHFGEGSRAGVSNGVPVGSVSSSSGDDDGQPINFTVTINGEKKSIKTALN